MKWIFLFLFFIVFDVFSAPTIEEKCPLGYRNAQESGGCWLNRTNADGCDIQVSIAQSPNNQCGIGTVNGDVATIMCVLNKDCAVKEDDMGDESCFPEECEEDQKCTTPSGDTFNLNQSDNCGNYCEVGNHDGSKSIVSCGGVPNPQPGDGPATSDGPSDGSWDCNVNPFMCAYDTNNDGEISDQDNPDQWPDPNDGLPDNSGCINWGPTACDVIDDHYGENNGGNNNGGDGNGGDGNGGDGNGGDGNGGDGNGGDGNGGDGNGGDGSGGEGSSSTAPGDLNGNGQIDEGEVINCEIYPSYCEGGEAQACNDYDSCYQLALSASNCADGTRDTFLFNYVNFNNVQSDCLTCQGPTALTFTECQTSTCPHGYDAASNKCWSASCPQGDCANPENPESKENIEQPEQDSDIQKEMDRVTGYLKDILRELQNPNPVPSAIHEQTEALKAQIESLESSNKSLSETEQGILNGIKDGIGKVEQAVKSIDLSNNTTTDYTSILDSINQSVDQVSCNLNPVGEDCAPSTKEFTPELNLEPLSDSIEKIHSTGIASAFKEMSEIDLNINSDCTSMVYTVPLKFVEGDITIDVCQWFKPMEDLIRLAFIVMWGFVGFRILASG